MQIILLEKVVNLGNLGEVVKVKDGYARNFLIPSGQARRATGEAIKEFKHAAPSWKKQPMKNCLLHKRKARSSKAPPSSSHKKQALMDVCSALSQTLILRKS